MSSVKAPDTHPSLRTTPVTAVIFDVDGTLADSFTLGFSATQNVLLDAGYQPITPEE
jgi:phosphoglycolate phosphatase-like HAD superfamily hydrolase